MPAVSIFKIPVLSPPLPSSIPRIVSHDSLSILARLSNPLRNLYSYSALRKTLFRIKSSEEGSEVSGEEDEWLQKLPDRKKPLYSHSLPCVEAWLKSLGFYQSRDDRAVWFVENRDWHAQLNLDVTDLYIRTQCGRR
ncbi:hypothetical protein F511_12978 [Dorcoceras hygrometricum]|uniref:Uncharacterized protein n=1 Tax=Dorcoceras hygrometricum TaxID=472368 RepID=A0A2Z7BGC6_9LAMI|nr:hypothetical protein F511_12978 [Dorcoceras hygrometricum]